MARLFILLSAVLLLHTSCRHKPTPLQMHGVFDSLAHNIDSLVLKAKEDSLDALFEQDKLFYPTIVSLSDEDSLAFIYVDSTFKDVLTPTDRRDYYRQARRLVPERILQVHQRIWRLPELRAQQAGNGGIYTVLTMVVDTPAQSSGFYSIEVKRNYIWRLGTVTDMGFIRYYPAADRIEITDWEGSYLSLKQWRKWLKAH